MRHTSYSVRVLNLEDNPADAALVKRALEKENLDVEFRRVETREEFISCLDEANFDIVLSDHAMPRFRASDALALMQSRNLEVPFIIVSGVINEELAVTMLRQGASDYVLKDRLARLGPAVRTALRERDLRLRKERADSALRKSEALQRSILSSLEAHIAVLDPGGEIVAVSGGCERFAEANCEQDLFRAAVGRNYVDVCREAAEADASFQKALDGILRVLAGDASSFRCEYARAAPEGERWFSMHVTPLAGYGEGVVVSHQNISERRLAEKTLSESEALVKAVSDASMDGMAVFKAVREGKGIVDFEFVFVNPRFIELVGRRSEVLLGRRLLDLYPTTLTGIFETYCSVVETGEPAEKEVFYDHGGITGWFMVTAVRIADGLAVTVRDVTSKKERESALQQANARFEALGDSMPGLIFQLVRDGSGSVRMAYVSKGISEITSATTEQLREDASLLLEAIHPDDRLEFEAGVAMSEETLEPWVWQGRLGADGPVKWYRVASQPVRQADGSTLWNGVAMDVTAQMHAEEALSEARSHQEALFEQALDAVLIADDNARYVDANPAACDLLGYTREELMQMSIWDLTPSVDVETGRAYWKTFIEEGKQAGEYRLRRKDGTVREVEFRAVAGILPNRHLSVLRDVSDRREAETNRARMVAIVESSNDAIIGAAPDGTITDWNAAAERLFGYAADEIVGEPGLLLAPDDRKDEVRDLLADLWRGKRRDQFETVRRRKDGTTIEVSLSVSPIRDQVGNVVGGSVIARDVSSQKEFLRSTLEAKARAEEMTRLKTSLLTNMSHEIRTPLTGIIGFAEILADRAADEQRELAEYIAVSGDRLMQTLTSVLDLAQLEGGHMKIKTERVDVVHQTRQTLDMFRPEAERRGLYLHLDVAESDGFQALTDVSALDRILTHLCSNAVKFTREGRVDVTVGGDERDIRIEVRDTGIGIDADFLPFIFDEYKQESAGATRDFEGSGLGLTISKRLANLLGASLDVESEKGKGSTFTLRLPRVLGDAGTAAPRGRGEHGSDRLAGRTVLLVDDNFVVHQLVRSMIGEDCRLDYAADGADALTRAAETAYDAVLLDIDLGGGMTGGDVLRRMRTFPGYDAIPIVAVTAHALEGDRERFLGAGFDAYLSKPFRKKDVTALFLPHELISHDATPFCTLQNGAVTDEA